MSVTLNKAMEYFLDREEFEKCAEIRDLEILIENTKNERKNITVS
jgi:protein-arginine kinase activator protein McsA